MYANPEIHLFRVEAGLGEIAGDDLHDADFDKPASVAKTKGREGVTSIEHSTSQTGMGKHVKTNHTNHDYRCGIHGRREVAKQG